jgi:hypothetical protein
LQRVGQSVVAGVPGEDVALRARRFGDRRRAGVVAACFRVGVAVRVIAKLGQNPGAEDDAEAGWLA